MNSEDFKKYGYEFVDWMAEYMAEVQSYPVKSQVAPREIYNQIEDQIPEQGHSMDSVFEDFKNIILPGITHWQSPNFYAYFNANSSPPSVLAEMLTATLGIQGMKWDTSPASTELEERMMEWLMQAMGIPKGWSGVIQDSASSASLAAILTAREQVSQNAANEKGMNDVKVMRVYCSDQTHSSIEKGAKIAGIGKENVVKIPTDGLLQMDTVELEKAIKRDLEKGMIPTIVVSALGTTGTTAMDPIAAISEITSKYNVWHHIDAAYVGSALLLPEYQHLILGLELADSFVFNPHKWLFTNFDCSAYFVKDKRALINTFAILPEYLKTEKDGLVDNHCDWGVPLGRRFRSLKLWFVLRYYGMDGLRRLLRSHIQMAEWLERQINESHDFEMVLPRTMNLVCFHFKPKGLSDSDEINSLNESLLKKLNQSGKLYMTHTKVKEIYTLRLVVGQTNASQDHIERAWKTITTMSATLI